MNITFTRAESSSNLRVETKSPPPEPSIPYSQTPRDEKRNAEPDNDVKKWIMNAAATRGYESEDDYSFDPVLSRGQVDARRLINEFVEFNVEIARLKIELQSGKDRKAIGKTIGQLDGKIRGIRNSPPWSKQLELKAQGMIEDEKAKLEKIVATSNSFDEKEVLTADETDDQPVTAKSDNQDDDEDDMFNAEFFNEDDQPASTHQPSVTNTSNSIIILDLTYKKSSDYQKPKLLLEEYLRKTKSTITIKYGILHRDHGWQMYINIDTKTLGNLFFEMKNTEYCKSKKEAEEYVTTRALYKIAPDFWGYKRLAPPLQEFWAEWKAEDERKKMEESSGRDREKLDFLYALAEKIVSEFLMQSELIFFLLIGCKSVRKD